jgi:hypothetical protein
MSEAVIPYGKGEKTQVNIGLSEEGKLAIALANDISDVFTYSPETGLGYKKDAKFTAASWTKFNAYRTDPKYAAFFQDTTPEDGPDNVF